MKRAAAACSARESPGIHRSSLSHTQPDNNTGRKDGMNNSLMTY
jgi:hypothetical protein